MGAPSPRFGVVVETDLPPPTDCLLRVADRRHVALRHAASTGYRGAAWSFLTSDPVDVVEERALTEPGALRSALAPLAPCRLRRRGRRLPFAGGWIGVLGYEARSGVESRPPPRPSPPPFPALWLGRYDAALAWDHRSKKTYAAGLGSDAEAARAAADALVERVRSGPPPAPAPIRAAVPRAHVSAARYRSAVRTIRHAIREGEVFQVNLSHAFDARVEGRAADVFVRLAASQPAPYMTFVDLGDERAVLSATPERFLRLRGREAESDPMKGTRPRGRTRAEDDALRAELDACEKERAELAMIVDLVRNDLSRVCRAGSVEVKVPRRILRLPRVHQAIAVVRGTLAPGTSRMDLIAAAFPPGSVTGAPKVRAMEIIDEHEQEARGPYCGALGLFDAGGDMDLAVAIRTLLLAGPHASYRVGGGITLRSDDEAEWQETLVKGRGLYHALAGVEHTT